MAWAIENGPKCIFNVVEKCRVLLRRDGVEEGVISAIGLLERPEDELVVHANRAMDGVKESHGKRIFAFLSSGGRGENRTGNLLQRHELFLAARQRVSAVERFRVSVVVTTRSFLELVHPGSQELADISSRADVEAGKFIQDPGLAHRCRDGVDDGLQLARVENEALDDEASVDITGGEPFARVGVEVVIAIEGSQTNGEEGYPPSVRRHLNHITRLQARHSIADVDQLAPFEARSHMVMGRQNALLVGLGILRRGQDIDRRRGVIARWPKAEDGGWIFGFPFP